MKFKMNNREWNIKEVDLKTIQDEAEEENKKVFYFGLTQRSTQEVLLNKDLCYEQKRQTLYHELMHVYLTCYFSLTEIQYTEELLCDITSNSSDMINKIIDDYFSIQEV